MNFRFPSHEKLKDPRSIAYLLEHGNKFHYFPLLFFTAPLPDTDPENRMSESKEPFTVALKVAFTVPKKSIRKATDRNKIKRRMREAWRLQKKRIPVRRATDHQSTRGVVVLFIGKEISEYSAIFKAMNRYIDQLASNK